MALIVIALTASLLISRRHRQQAESPASLPAKPENPRADTPDEGLFERISQLMEDQKLYLDSELKISDVADKLGTNKRYISDCLNTQKGYTFTNFVNTYRIKYAQRLMRNQPDTKITEVYYKSGFANETSFFRTFKSITGMTPRQWMKEID